MRLLRPIPDHITAHNEKDVIWRDGSRSPISNGRSGKTFDQMLDDPDIKDQFAIPYPLGTALKIPAVNEDPGRIPYICRPIAQTNRLSIHAYGAAIDLATKFGDYWLWSKGKDGKITWKNRIPLEFVDIFERAGFIWGGKWYHFDTLRFEYRPEIIALAKQGWPGN